MALIVSSFDKGSNGNGHWQVDPTGILRCWYMLTLTFTADYRLTESWNFPKEFSALPHGVKITINDNLQSAWLGKTNLRAYYGGITTTSVRIDIFAPDPDNIFESGDTIDVFVEAIGPA